MSPPLDVRRLGVVPYADALELQRELVEQRRANKIPDTLLLLEHPHVITLGVRVRGNWSHVLASRESLEARGVEVFDSGRGGDVTYHGPGQLVGYPVLALGPGRQDLHRYVRDLEEVLIRTVAEYGISAGRIRGLTGVWVRDEKIAAIGVRVSRWVTSHGFALNVSTNLDYFRLIVPCGIVDRGVTSIARCLGHDPGADAVSRIVAAAFAQTFDLEILR